MSTNHRDRINTSQRFAEAIRRVRHELTLL
jgi:hypothetical protein